MLVGQAVSAVEFFTGRAVSHSVISDITQKLYSDKRNIVLIGMPSCGKSSLGKKLAAKLAGITGKQIELTNTIDPACIGGVRLDYDGKRVDDTILHRLDAVSIMLKNTIL